MIIRLKQCWWPILLLGATLGLTGQSAYAETLTIGAAHSLKPVLREVIPLFESRNPTIRVRVVYGPSQTQREQIEQGAPLDLYLPASFDQIRALQAKGLTVNGPPRIYARSALVLIASSQTAPLPVSFKNLGSKAVSRIAIGNPETDALGLLTSQLLAKVDPDRRLQGRITYGHHNEIIPLVQSGEADVGIVFHADAAHNERVRILDEAPTAMLAPVELGMAVVWTCRPPALPLAQKFMEFVLSPAAQGVLREHGFQPAAQQTDLTPSSKP